MTKIHVYRKRISRRAPRGFTLVEIMVVVVIISLLAGIVGVRVINSLEKGKQGTARAEISALKTALQNFYIDQGFYPTTEMGLEALISQPSDGRVEDYPEGGYIDKREIPTDPWGNEYEYTSPGSENPEYEIVSHGRDGLPGGDGFDADIKSWEL